MALSCKVLIQLKLPLHVPWVAVLLMSVCHTVWLAVEYIGIIITVTCNDITKSELVITVMMPTTN